MILVGEEEGSVRDRGGLVQSCHAAWRDRQNYQIDDFEPARGPWSGLVNEKGVTIDEVLVDKLKSSTVDTWMLGQLRKP